MAKPSCAYHARSHVEAREITPANSGEGLSRLHMPLGKSKRCPTHFGCRRMIAGMACYPIKNFIRYRLWRSHSGWVWCVWLVAALARRHAICWMDSLNVPSIALQAICSLTLVPHDCFAMGFRCETRKRTKPRIRTLMMRAFLMTRLVRVSACVVAFALT